MRGGPFSDGTFSTSTKPRCSILTSSGVDGALDDVGEALLAQPRRDLVAVRRLHGQDREDDALERALEHLGHLLAHEPPPFNYSVLLTTSR